MWEKNLVQRIDSYLSFLSLHPHLADNSQGQLEIVTDRELLLEWQQRLYERADKNNKPRCYYDIGIVAEDDFVVVLRDLVRFGEDRYGGYIRMLNRNSSVNKTGKDVVILARLDGKYVLLRHFRHDSRRWFCECPRGFGEKGLSAEENAVKEISEETGLGVKKLCLLNDENEDIAYFLAECIGRLQVNDTGEGIDNIFLADKSSLYEKIADGSVRDEYTFRAIALADIKGL